MNKFKAEFLKVLDEAYEDGEGINPNQIDRQGDVGSITDEFGNPLENTGASDASYRNQLDRAADIERSNKEVLEWQNKVIAFDTWISDSLLSGLDTMKSTYTLNTDKVEKEIGSLRNAIGGVNTQLGLLPRDIQVAGGEEEENQ